MSAEMDSSLYSVFGIPEGKRIYLPCSQNVWCKVGGLPAIHPTSLARKKVRTVFPLDGAETQELAYIDQLGNKKSGVGLGRWLGGEEH